MVKSRRERSAAKRVAPLDGRLSRMVDVGLGAKGRHLDLDAVLAQDPAQRPEGPTLLPRGAAERPQQSFDVVGARVRGEVDLLSSGCADAEQRVAHRATDRVEREARRAKGARERSGQLRDFAESIVGVGVRSHCE